MKLRSCVLSGTRNVNSSPLLVSLTFSHLFKRLYPRIEAFLPEDVLFHLSVSPNSWLWVRLRCGALITDKSDQWQTLAVRRRALNTRKALLATLKPPNSVAT